MTDVPIEMLAASAPEIKGMKLTGFVTVSLGADVKQQSALSGHFEAREVRYDNLPLGRLSGDFWLIDEHIVRLTNGHLEGLTLTANVAGSATREGAFSLTAQIIAADLRQLGLPGVSERRAGIGNALGLGLHWAGEGARGPHFWPGCWGRGARGDDRPKHSPRPTRILEPRRAGPCPAAPPATSRSPTGGTRLTRAWPESWN